MTKGSGSTYVVCLSMLLGDLRELHADKLVASLLEPANNVGD